MKDSEDTVDEEENTLRTYKLLRDGYIDNLQAVERQIH